jgi:esterase
VTARLHHERIARSEARRWLLVTHGIYGAGSNWRAIARKLTVRRPEWGVVLVDLRQHGRSEPGDPPHTLAACADDVAALVRDVPVDVLAGHSFGGKVVLAAHPVVHPHQTWVLDATPSALPNALSDPGNTVVRVLELMERLPRTWTRRDEFVAAVVAEGYDAGLAQWLAMNVVPEATGTLVLRLDLAALRALLADYYARDLWPIVEGSAAGALHVVIATRSPVISATDRERLARSPAHVHAIDAGHWLHIEAQAQMIDLFADHLPA